MFVFFEKKNRYTFRHNVHDNIQEMIPKQAIYHFQEGDDTENSQENTRTKDHVSNRRLKPTRHWWCHRRTTGLQRWTGSKGRRDDSSTEIPGNSPHLSPVACHKERTSTGKTTTFNEWKQPDVCLSDEIGTIVKHAPHKSQSCLIHTTRKEERRALNSRLNRFDRRPNE